MADGWWGYCLKYTNLSEFINMSQKAMEYKTHKKGKTDLTPPVQSKLFMKAQGSDNFDIWDQHWTSFKSQIIAGKFNTFAY